MSETDETDVPEPAKNKGGSKKGSQHVLSPLQERWAHHVAAGLSFAEAAREAGVKSEFNARQRGWLWSKKAKVMARVHEIQRKAGITQDRVLKETVAIAFSSVDHYVLGDDGELALAEGAPQDAMKAVSSIKYRTITTGTGENARTERICEFKLWNKPDMLKIAGRHVDTHGFWDRVELTGKDGGSLAELLRLAITQSEAPSVE